MGLSSTGSMTALRSSEPGYFSPSLGGSGIDNTHSPSASCTLLAVRGVSLKKSATRYSTKLLMEILYASHQALTRLYDSILSEIDRLVCFRAIVVLGVRIGFSCPFRHHAS